MKGAIEIICYITSGVIKQLYI